MKYFHLAIAGAATLTTVNAGADAIASKLANEAAKAQRHLDMELIRNQKQADRDQAEIDRAAQQAANEQAKYNLHVAKQAAMNARQAAKDQDNLDNQDRAAFRAWEKDIKTMLKREADFEKRLLVKGWEEIEGIPRTDFPMYAQAKFTFDGDNYAFAHCRGDVFFKQTSFSQTEVYYNFVDCIPNHDHKFHIHADHKPEEVGDCVALAGGHFNPWNGADTSDMYYITNMGNVMTDGDGNAIGQASRPHYVRLTDVMSPDGGVTNTSVLGRSIVVHDAAGPRIACGGPITAGPWVAGENGYLPTEN